MTPENLRRRALAGLGLALLAAVGYLAPVPIAPVTETADRRYVQSLHARSLAWLPWTP